MQIVSNSTVAAENCALPPARPNKETTFVNVTGNRTKRDFWETDDTAVTPIFVGGPKHGNTMAINQRDTTGSQLSFY